jgi:hypothetical protein
VDIVSSFATSLIAAVRPGNGGNYVGTPRDVPHRCDDGRVGVTLDA